jgi:hypothetical protein
VSEWEGTQIQYISKKNTGFFFAFYQKAVD